MANSYILLNIPGAGEAVMAVLSDMGFEAFEEKDESVVAYLPQSLYTDALIKAANEVLNQFDLSGSWSDLPDQNWNELWESKFEPVEVPGVCRVRANFHPRDPAYEYEILIQPRMAFGTGHHQTTYMMLKLMHGIDMQNKKVFDFGCGTGILAIFASMRGAKSIVANDIEHESYVNTVENAAANQVQNIEVFEGGIDVISDTSFDVILANINRNVLIQSAERLALLTVTDGTLLMSGILDTDEEMIINCFEAAGFGLQQKEQKDKWLCLKWKRN